MWVPIAFSPATGSPLPAKEHAPLARLEQEIGVDPGGSLDQSDCRVRLRDVARDEPEPPVERVVVHLREFAAVERHG
jgi:hypothetical protein